MIDLRSASSPATPAAGSIDGLDLLAHVVVGDAEHGDVADARVREDLAFDLGRVDVHAARR